MMNIRPSAVAGTFYPFPRQALEKEVQLLLEAQPEPRK